jgi:CBS domain-containing protein
MRDILSIPFGDVSEGLTRLAGLALCGKPVYADADSMVVDVDHALRSKEVRLLPVLDGTSLLGLVDVSAPLRFAAREPRRSAEQ